MVILEVIQADPVNTGYQKTRVFSATGGSLGRSERCDWVLPDSNRVVSSEHAKIRFLDGKYYLIDCSTNGILDTSGRAIAKEPQLLQEGQILIEGAYHIRVKGIRIESDQFAMKDAGFMHIMNEAKGTADLTPLKPRDAVVALTDMHDPLSYAASKSDPFQTMFEPLNLQTAGVKKPVDETVLPDFSLEEAFGSKVSERASHKSEDRFSMETIIEKPTQAEARISLQVEEKKASLSSKPVFNQPSSVLRPPDKQPAADFLELFCQHFALDPRLFDRQPRAELYQSICDTLDALLQGMITLMVNRAKIKNALKLDMTMIQPSQNNPMKFAVTTRQALEMLLRPQGSAFLAPKEAINTAVSETVRHEESMFSALRASIPEVAELFDPKNVSGEKGPASRGSWASQLNVFAGRGEFKKYQQYFEALTDNGADKLYQQFIGIFAEAYLKNINKEGALS